MSFTTNLMDLAVTASLSPGIEWPDPLENDMVFTQTLVESQYGSMATIPAERPLPATRYVEEEEEKDGGEGEEYAKREKELLVVSPYTERAHLLDMSSVEQPSQLLARALTILRPVRSDYAIAPYDRAFNWSAVVDYLKSLLAAEHYSDWEDQRFYIVVFRSQIPRTTDRSRLGKLDKLAHQEAMEAGGLLKYWFGTPDRTGRNLATCVWRRRGDAKLGGAGPGHAKAMQETRALYTEWKVQRLSLNIGKNAESWSITEWDD